MSKLHTSIPIAQDSLDIYYKSGDTFSVSNKHVICGGLVSSSTKTCAFDYPLPKLVPISSNITVSALNAAIRTTAGAYLDNKSDSNNNNWILEDYTVTAYPTNGSNMIRIAIVKNNEAFTNVSNNTPVGAWVRTLTITFS